MIWQLGPPQRAGEHSNDPSPHCLCAGTNIVVRAMLPLRSGLVNMFARGHASLLRHEMKQLPV